MIKVSKYILAKQRLLYILTGIEQKPRIMGYDPVSKTVPLNYLGLVVATSPDLRSARMFAASFT